VVPGGLDIEFHEGGGGSQIRDERAWALRVWLHLRRWRERGDRHLGWILASQDGCYLTGKRYGMAVGKWTEETAVSNVGTQSVVLYTHIDRGPCHQLHL